MVLVHALVQISRSSFGIIDHSFVRFRYCAGRFLSLTWIGWPCGALPRHAFRGFADFPRFTAAIAALRLFSPARSLPISAFKAESLFDDPLFRTNSAYICLSRLTMKSACRPVDCFKVRLRFAAAYSPSQTSTRFRASTYLMASSRERLWFLNRRMKGSPKPGLASSQISFICASTLAALAPAFAAAPVL